MNYFDFDASAYYNKRAEQRWGGPSIDYDASAYTPQADQVAQKIWGTFWKESNARRRGEKYPEPEPEPEFHPPEDPKRRRMLRTIRRSHIPWKRNEKATPLTPQEFIHSQLPSVRVSAKEDQVNERILFDQENVHSMEHTKRNQDLYSGKDAGPPDYKEAVNYYRNKWKREGAPFRDAQTLYEEGHQCVCNQVRRVSRGRQTALSSHNMVEESKAEVLTRIPSIIRLSKELIQTGMISGVPHPLPIFPGNKSGNPCGCSVIGPVLMKLFTEYLGSNAGFEHISSLGSGGENEIRKRFAKSIEQELIQHGHLEHLEQWIPRAIEEQHFETGRHPSETHVKPVIERMLHREKGDDWDQVARDTADFATDIHRNFAEYQSLKERGFDPDNPVPGAKYASKRPPPKKRVMFRAEELKRGKRER